MNRNAIVVIALILVIVGVALILTTNNSLLPSKPPVASPSPAAVQVSQQDWKSFENKQYNISFKYPPTWSINKNTQLFENGDLVAVQFTGATQQEQTEFYDGARFVVMIPQATNLDLNSWVESRHKANVSGSAPQFSDTVINGVTFRKVYECGLGCFTYYYRVVGGQGYGVVVSAAGPQEVELNATISEILKTVEIGS
ncbi:hypothetical protein A3D81_01735 [Candidatus Curtissbacteria bacterium RIFCSPHIGHO2_02_FULL_40_17]|uniref:PsbP C-terminal domain-containing protein n=3 Tax=Microgenomates group TaxID=1794810 RepID=A0A1F7JX73_9BACT|nr:MAG: hypothetical protein A3D81_01735 [Candidatus Curtissbacteria bacterium RIFCSPHIGHO2_02_FULL_40_17]OGE05063.1 MAG: hypothetical protein A3F45_02525 [Candidatus Curtissbacteria bacterium RIFCSPHIGHO2_12_FULL_41_17]OGK60210.1 MAG: hypothetical protein A3I56_04845 [Candidatus Roizmanbacteria bacterium RIFCSPLOWO2_02_FULL_43_10]